MRRRKRLWERLYSAIWDNDKDAFLCSVKAIEDKYFSIKEYEELLFKAGITLLEEFDDAKRAKVYFDKYLERFGEDGRFSEQIHKRTG